MLEFSVARILEEFTVGPGDVFITNDPFVGGTHFNDVGIIRPVFWDSQLLGLVAICGHWPDVGGQEPGSFVAEAREHFQEGLRIPPVKLFSGGEPDRAVFDLIMANMRVPRDRLGDLRAQTAATAVAESRLLELAGLHSPEVVGEAMLESIAYSERLMRREIGEIPAGTYFGEDFVDVESVELPRPKRVHLQLTVGNEEMTFDFSQSDSESMSASNSTYSATTSAVLVTTKSLFPDVPMNHGCLAPLRIVARDGTLVSARPPRAISSMAATVYEKVIGATLAAFAQAIPRRAVGCPYNLINLTIGGRQDGEEYIAYLFSEGGFGGRATRDGPSALVSLYGGGAKITPVEVMERRYPIRFHEWALWADSAGPGMHRGGVGSRKVFSLSEGTARLSCLGDRERFPPFGILGGSPGAKHGLLSREGTTEQRDLTLKVSGYRLEAGEQITILAGGGGGYGDPFQRDLDLVVADVRKGYVTPEGARNDYGVIVSAEAVVDAEASEALRSNRRAERR
jgi:N-methylhydantoinase B